MTPLFCQAEFSKLAAGQQNALRKEIEGLTQEYLAGVTDEKLAEYLYDKYALEAPTIGEPYVESDKEVKVDVRNDWRRAVRDKSKPLYVTGHRIEVRLPFTGLSQLFNVAPSIRTLSPPVVNEIEPDYLELVFEGAELQSEQIRQSLDSTVAEIAKHLENLKSDCDGFNADLKHTIPGLVGARRREISSKRKIVEGIGLPIKQRQDAPRTYAVPDVRKKPKIARPTPMDIALPSEPALVQQEYEHILSMIRSMVHVIERSPNAFKTMQEEDLRTQFLVQLNGQYEGRASGETFNYQGKTDILIRDGDRNIFIAECAFWKGEAYLTEKIDQILSYLHWRDTKAALVVFNRNRSFSDVLAKIEPTVKSHACCKKLLSKDGETEWRFLFRNAGDPNRKLQLAVLLFDVPKATA